MLWHLPVDSECFPECSITDVRVTDPQMAANPPVFFLRVYPVAPGASGHTFKVGGIVAYEFHNNRQCHWETVRCPCIAWTSGRSDRWQWAPVHLKDLHELSLKTGVRRTRTVPYRPPSNMSADWYVKTVKRDLQRQLLDDRSVKRTIQHHIDLFLFRYRNTPSSTCGIIPVGEAFKSPQPSATKLREAHRRAVLRSQGQGNRKKVVEAIRRWRPCVDWKSSSLGWKVVAWYRRS